MKLTRKRAIEMALNGGHCDTKDCEHCAEIGRGVDYGIVLGLQMALDDNPNGYDKPASYMAALQRLIARRLRILEKAR